ncbi:MAG TPA: translation initiation factor IF-2 [Limnochordales bacterium]
MRPEAGRRPAGGPPAAPGPQAAGAAAPAAAARGPVELPERIVVRELASRLGVAVPVLIKQLMKQGVMATITQEIPFEVASRVAQDLGFVVERPKSEEERFQERVRQVQAARSPQAARPRPPVVTIMGHVDHGKTTLLDAIRKTRVAAQEYGGITQHIGAYQVELNGRRITFLDTPGHEAFTAMRARGAQVTDVAVLVVAADDGVMPQTVEAIDHARAANVPIVVALNKIDKPAANPDRVKQQLAELGLVPEEWGGDTVMVPVSALRQEGIQDLLEMILLVADLRELKANPDGPAEGVVIEAQLDRGRGPVATVLVREGTLRVGDPVVAGTVAGRVRALMDDQGRSLPSAGPSTPVVVLGLEDVPQPGDTLVVAPDEESARRVAQERLERLRTEQLRPTARATLEALARAGEQEAQELRMILKADVQGSLEALRSALGKLAQEPVKLHILHAAVGGITEADVNLASASGAVIFGFNVRPDANARRAAERDRVEIRTYRVIYELIDDVKAAMAGLLKPRVEERVVGRAEVRRTFKVPGVGVVAGCYVTEGKLLRGGAVRVVRDGVVVFDGRIGSLKRFKDDVREVAQGFECGVGIERFQDVKEGDVLEAYETVEVAPAAPGVGAAGRA